MRSFARVMFLLCAVVAALAATGALDIDVHWRDNVAQAIDLFGSKEEAKPVPAAQADNQADNFWKEGSGTPAVVPSGVPNTFADLSERVSPGVVNISTKKTITAHSLEDFFPFPFQQDPFGAPP